MKGDREEICPGRTLSEMRDNPVGGNLPALKLATPAGLEPATCRLEGGCSIQLSYGVVTRD